MSTADNASTQTSDPSPTRHRRWPALIFVGLGVSIIISLLINGCTLANRPSSKHVLAPDDRHPAPAYDLWGRSVSQAEAAEMLTTQEGRAILSPANGAVKVDREVLSLGERAFYRETFGNEVFLTDVMGILDGPIKPGSLLKAIDQLDGKGTTNLRVEVSEDAVIGGRQFRKGQMIDTGLDVPKGANQPLGMAVSIEPKLRVGISCSLCHSTVDPDSKLVVHGAPNADFNAGLLMALGSNTAAYFTHTGIRNLQQFVKDPSRTIVASDGQAVPLPDPASLEQAVDATLLKWKPGSFDSVGDCENNPTDNPDSFTWGDWPYNWSGAFVAGPFKGLSVQTNNVHALNSDAFTQIGGVKAQLGIDPELYYAVLLQNAANRKFRYDPRNGKTPSEFFRSVDPTEYGPALVQAVALPTFPNASLVETTGIWVSDPGRPVWQKINAMAAWQNTLIPPAPPRLQVDQKTLEMGRAAFERAQCASCHSGPALTNNRVVGVREIGTQPARAHGLKSTQNNWSQQTLAWAFDQEVPLPEDARILKVPTEHLDHEQIRTAFAHGDSPGGYKTPSLIGLYWSAPYLHDGGVAVGPGGEPGLPATVKRHMLPDPFNSLKAMVDRNLRQRVIEANHADPDLKAINIEGTGHEFWVDAPAGYSEQEQRAMILYLLTYRPAGTSEQIASP